MTDVKGAMPKFNASESIRTAFTNNTNAVDMKAFFEELAVSAGLTKSQGRKAFKERKKALDSRRPWVVPHFIQDGVLALLGSNVVRIKPARKERPEADEAEERSLAA